MSEFSIDQGHAALDNIFGKFAALALSNANEAETRAKVIDCILKDVLGWREEDISREERVSEDGKTTFADYIVQTATTAFIVEAKKAGATFSISTSQTSGKLGGVLKEGLVGECIRQVRDYCRKRHIPFALVTNGSSWIIFPAVRTDQVTFEDTQATIFKDLKAIRERFVQFWELLSRQRVTEGNLENELLGSERKLTGRRVLSLVHEPGFRLGRNALYEYIEPAINSALTDEALLNDPEALKLCYVRSSERVKYDSRLQMYVNDAKTYLGHKTVRVRSKKSASYFETKLSEGVHARPRFILVLGSVGSGKTTFLFYTRNVSGLQLIQGKMVWAYVDFKKTTTNENPRDFLYGELLRIIESDEEFHLGDWKTSIMPAYAEVIKNFERGPLYLLKKSNPAEFDKRIAEVILEERSKVVPYVDRILSHALKSKSGFLVVDNVDQIDSDERQNEIFLEAHAIAQKVGVNIIMSLREITYLRHRNKPVFDAFQFDSLYIDSPSILPVLSRRLSYAKKVLAGKKAELVLESGARLKVPDLSIFFDIVTQSLLDGDAGYMIGMLSGGDVRRGLSLVREFLASGHTTADRALRSYIDEGRYNFPAHEVFKGALLGKRKVYREEESLIPNLYDAKLGSDSLQLLRFQIIKRLVHLASVPNFEGIGVSEIIEQLHSIGISCQDVMRSLDILFQSRIIKTTDGLNLSDKSQIVPTRLAGYLVRELSCTFTYVEMCLIDSFIHDENVWKEIADLTRQIETSYELTSTIKLRVDRVNLFMKYLIFLEERWAVECKRRNLEESWGTIFIGSQINAGLAEDITRVIASAERMSKRRTDQSKPVLVETPSHKAMR
jgi:hypothetical protein